MSSASPSPTHTPHNELLEFTQQLTPSKTPRRIRQICLDVQSRANNASEAHDVLKRKLADITNQLGNAQPPRKRRFRHNRATEAPDDVENPATLEERVRSAGRHHSVEFGLFLHTGVLTLFATPLDPDFDEDTEFDTEESRIQGQLRDIIALLPDDAKDLSIRKHEWVAKCFDDGLSGQRSNINTRIRQESIMYIVANTNFKDWSQDPPANIPVNLIDLDSSSSRFNAFAQRIGFQEATADADAYYSPLKAEVLYKEYGGTMDPFKIFRGPALLNICVHYPRSEGAKGLFQGESKLPSAPVIERTRHIQRTTPGAIANSAVLAIWLFSADTQLVADGDETKIDYQYLWMTFMRQICEGLREDADWAKDLFSYWDGVLFPNADNSHSQAPSANRLAVRAEVDAMDAVFKAATVPSESSQPGSSQASASHSTARHENSPVPSESQSSQPGRASQSSARRESSPPESPPVPSRSQSSNRDTRRRYSRRQRN
ncbi:hypothetical protein C8J57DRAFT_1561857 [Mycena rebaudengoi]|nr:hypothetical protein C8J57DRAFT_1561857 [Mycena rebaudengoi]